MKARKTLLPLLILLTLITSCNRSNLDETTVTTNRWIWEEMDLWYLWNQYIPDYEETDIDPTTYFNSLLYDSKDKWSFITENYRDLINSFQGIEKAMGYSLALYYKDDAQNDVVAFVEFVYHNTPAARAGIKRGDIIGSVNGSTLNVENYIDLLFYTDNQTLGFLSLNSSGYSELSGNVQVSAEIIEENPVIMDTIYQISGKTIGYLAYVGFISNFNSSLDTVFSKFKNANITDLILDLRYNPGGDVGAANYLCSSLAPESEVFNQKRLINYNWNSDVMSFLQDNEYYDNLYVNLRNDVKVNLNLSKVHILTTGRSASASELTIIGLRPYMDVITIGEATHGKYTASITIPDKDSIWALQPIVIKYSNADGFTDFIAGLTPDYIIEDNIRYALGDPNDPLIAKAINVMGGVLTSPKNSIMSKSHGKFIQSVGRNPVIQNGVLKINHFKIE